MRPRSRSLCFAYQNEGRNYSGWELGVATGVLLIQRVKCVVQDASCTGDDSQYRRLVHGVCRCMHVVRDSSYSVSGSGLEHHLGRWSSSVPDARLAKHTPHGAQPLKDRSLGRLYCIILSIRASRYLSMCSTWLLLSRHRSLSTPLDRHSYSGTPAYIFGWQIEPSIWDLTTM